MRLAAEYRQEHGDLRVPKSYVAPCGRKLGKWIERQRAAYKGSSSCVMNDDRRVALEALGMEWSLEKRAPWESYYRLAQRYSREHGGLHIPIAYRSHDGLGVGEWVKQQRKRYRKGLLTRVQILRLESIGMQWTAAQLEYESPPADSPKCVDRHGLCG